MSSCGEIISSTCAVSSVGMHGAWPGVICDFSFEVKSFLKYVESRNEAGVRIRPLKHASPLLFETNLIAATTTMTARKKAQGKSRKESQRPKYGSIHCPHRH
eukprot:scaffold13173_cov78-Cyclotella_meneghiniana.AAC.1